jgi:hypothetical protein
MAQLKDPTPEVTALSETAASFGGDPPVVTTTLPVVIQGAMLPGLETWCAAVVECQREMANFVAQRLAKDQETIREAMGSKDWAAITTIQARWLQQTMQDYTAEVSKILSIYTKQGVAYTPTIH